MFSLTGGRLQCTFVEEFTGNQLDPESWVRQDTARTGFRLGRTCFSPTRNVVVGGGAARLSVTRSFLPFSCRTPGGSFATQYLGADISTWGKFSQTYGRFEARLRFPGFEGAGYHGGFWGNPQQLLYGAWPASGEIDIAEWWSVAPERVFPSLHYTGRTREDTGWSCVMTNPEAFHTYAVEWTRDRMSFIYDGRTCFTRSWAPTTLTAPAPFDKPFYLSLTFGEGWPLGPATSSTPFPATMVVDYVKAWQ